jgi:hypothetical protein
MSRATSCAGSCGIPLRGWRRCSCRRWRRVSRAVLLSSCRASFLQASTAATSRCPGGCGARATASAGSCSWSKVPASWCVRGHTLLIMKSVLSPSLHLSLTFGRSFSLIFRSPCLLRVFYFTMCPSVSVTLATLTLAKPLTHCTPTDCRGHRGRAHAGAAVWRSTPRTGFGPGKAHVHCPCACSLAYPGNLGACRQPCLTPGRAGSVGTHCCCCRAGA